MPSQEVEKVLPFYQDTGYGFNICGSFNMDSFKSALAYEPRPDDLFIVTYPKCGTTWVQNIVACIYREGKPFASALEFLTNTPFLEMAGAEAAKTMQRPGAIKLHLPFHLTPWSSKSKYIFVARNPKDCCVSFYHHTKNIVGYKFKNGSFDDYFELFMDGKVDFGDYFDTLISWYEHRNDPNVLFITYEDLTKNTRENILKIAEFMGRKYKDMLTEDENILNDVIKYSSFDFMKQTLNRQVAELASLPRDFILNHPDLPQGIKTLLTSKDSYFDWDPNSITFVRKGIVGDYKNHFSAEQNKRLEEKFRERTKGTDIPDLWKDIMMSSHEEKKVLPFYQDTGCGFSICGSFDIEAFKSALTYKPRPDDIFIVTYPKCGTTWVQNIVACIYRKGKPFSSAEEFNSKTPYLEMAGAKAAEATTRQCGIKTHLPFHLVPWSPQAKYIFVARNPKDCCVSFYHHTKSVLSYRFENGIFDDFFELFIEGKVDYGDYFDTLISWYEHRNDPNVLFIIYEDLKKDTRENILKIAEFMGENYREMLTKDEKILNDVVKHSSFDFMKQQGFFESDPDSVTFARKGIVGDYKNHLSPEQNRRLEGKFWERTKGTDITELWKDIM